MSQKKRIIELVKQNVLSMEEALQLLEAGLPQQESKTANLNEFVTEYQTAQKEVEEAVQKPNVETEEVEQKVNYETLLEELNQKLSKKEDALLITRQRLREVEIFAELDELTADMEAQFTTLKEKVNTLESEISHIQKEISSIKKAQVKDIQLEFKQKIDDTTEQVAQAARDFGKEAKKEGKNIQQSVLKGIKEFASNFDIKSVNVNIPWLKSTNLQHTYEYEVQDLTQVDISLLNGSLFIEAHDLDTIEVVADITVYGSEERATLDAFENSSTIDISNNRLLFHVKGGTIAVDLHVKIPRKQVEHMNLGSLNGDIEIQNIEAKELYINSKNGDVIVSTIIADLLSLDVINGDIEVEDSQIADFDYHNINGDFRYKNNIGNLVADVINGDIVITKENTTASNLNLKSITGDIKVAVPDSVNLEIDASSSIGDVEHRLTNIDVLANLNRFERHLNDQAPLVKIEAKTNSGDIYLKG